MMMKTTGIVLAVAIAVLLAGCIPDELAGMAGKYTSSDDYGVMVFKSDGTFYYKFAAKVDFYDFKNLPPHRGTFKVNKDGGIEVLSVDEGTKRFLIERHTTDNSFDLVRAQPTGDFPERAKYRKVGQPSAAPLPSAPHAGPSEGAR